MKPSAFARFSRRRFLALCGASLPAFGFHSRVDAAAAGVPGRFSLAFDQAMETFMAPRRVPGGALAVVKDRRLVYARGYGWADRENRVAATADSLFRIASISKPVTAVAVLKLVEEGRLDLEAKALELLKLEPFLEEGATFDRRLEQITIRQLLQHTAGWDRDKTYDPMFQSRMIARKTGAPLPPDRETIIRYMLGRPLDFDPGTRHVYSNLTYCVLGRIIERVTGRPYDEYVKEKVLAPAGITRMTLGRTLEKNRRPGEVRYYMANGARGRNVFPEEPGEVSWPYGCFDLEAMDAHGGWLASAVDLVRFALALDDPARGPLLKPESIQTMLAPPPPPVSRNEDGSLRDRWYACGWFVRAAGAGGPGVWTHNGSLPGTWTWLARRSDGVIMAALFNQRSDDPKLPDFALETALHRVADGVRDWPEGDLFQRKA